MQKKEVKTTKLKDGEIRLSAETFEEFLDLVYGKIETDSSYTKSYPSRDWLDPPEYAQMEVEISGTLTFEELKKHFDVTEEFLVLLNDVIDNHDCLEYEDCEEVWKNFVEAIEDDIHGKISGYHIDSYSITLSIKEDKERVEFEFSVDDYSFDEYEYIEAGRPEPDPYDD